ALVGGAVERPDAGVGHTAAGVDAVAEERRGGFPVRGAGTAERVAPVVLDRVDDRHDRAVVVGVGVGAGAALGAQVVRCDLLTGPQAGQAAVQRNAAAEAADAAELGEQEVDDEADDTEPAATCHDTAADASGDAAKVADLTRVEVRTFVEVHVALLTMRRADVSSLKQRQTCLGAAARAVRRSAAPRMRGC